MYYSSMEKEIVLCITGASGTVYGLRLLEVLSENFTVNLIVSNSAFTVMEKELDISKEEFLRKLPENCIFYSQNQIYAPVASGSKLVQTEGVIVAPCSTGTLGAIANGISSNLIHRVCDVALKERKKLYLLIREMPLSLIHLQNMERVTQAGAIVSLASPGFYHKPQTIEDIINFVVGKVLDSFGIKHNLYKRWQG